MLPAFGKWRELVDVLLDGAVLLGHTVVCDAHANRPIRVVTHLHVDHTKGLRKSIRHCKHVVMTPATAEVLLTLRRLRSLEEVVLLPYEQLFDAGGEQLTLYPADHVIGAAQVVVEGDEWRVAYTGDFRLGDKTAILEDVDVLVMEATYGRPGFSRPWSQKVPQLFIKLVSELLRERPVYVYGYHGKLQEAMALLEAADLEAPKVAPPVVVRIAEICRRYGLDTGEVVDVQSREGREIVRSGRYVAFYHTRSKRPSLPHASILLSGWEVRAPIYSNSRYHYTVALSDHADYNQLLEYVAQVHPRFVVTDASRIGFARSLAHAIQRKLRIPATALPKGGPYDR